MFLTLLFILWLCAMIVLDIAMLISLLRPGDERRQMVVWKASTWTLMGLVGMLVIEIVRGFVTGSVDLINPFIHLTVTATMYFCFSLYFKRTRKELGLSQEELAKRCGVTRQTVNAIENNKYDPTLALAFALAGELGLTVDELFRP